MENKFNVDIAAKHREAIAAFVQWQAASLIAMGAVKVEAQLLSPGTKRWRRSQTP